MNRETCRGQFRTVPAHTFTRQVKPECAGNAKAAQSGWSCKCTSPHIAAQGLQARAQQHQQQQHQRGATTATAASNCLVAHLPTAGNHVRNNQKSQNLPAAMIQRSRRESSAVQDAMCTSAAGTEAPQSPSSRHPDVLYVGTQAQSMRFLCAEQR